jgi:hypothetical protein
VSILPEPIRALLGEALDFSYVEYGQYADKHGLYEFECASVAMPYKIQNSGEIHVEVEGARRVTRVAWVRVNVDFFPIGTLLEDQILRDLKAAYDKTAEFTQALIREKGL